MTDEGPTTVAKINAKIGADGSNAFREFAKVKADAKALGAIDPDIKITASGTAAVQGKLAAVQAAQEKLGLATDRLRIADQRYQEVQMAGTAKQSTVMAARLAAINAEKAETRATDELTAAKLALAAADEAEAAGSVKASNANKTNVSRMGLIITLIAALIPLIAPLAGYAVAVAGGLTAMGAAGILAIVGIRNEMAKGSLLGKTYAQGIRELKGDLDGLSHTAAVAMLNDYQMAVGQINGAMPFLNTSTRIFTDILGNTGNRVLSGVISALRVLNPLFVSGAVYVNQLAAGFQKWTQDGGLQKFASYAQGALPRVSDALGAIATALLHIIEATAPLGSVTLAILTAVSNAISAMPSDALVTIAAAATGGFLAFKAWGLIAPILSSVATAVGAVGIATEIATGPIGWIAAGVTALVAVFAVATAATQDQTSATHDYTAALQQDLGVIGAATTQQAALNLQQQGAFEMGKKLGLSQTTLTLAALGNADAMKTVSKALAEQGGIYPGLSAAQQGLAAASHEQAKAAHDLNGILETQRVAVKSQIDLYNELAMATGTSTVKTQGQLDAANALARQYGASTGAYQAAEGAQKSTADQLAATTLQMRLQNDASGLLANALTILNGGSLTVAQTQTGLAAANNGVVDALNANGDALNDNSKEAVANQQAIQGQVAAAQQAAEAIGQQTGSSKAAVDAYVASKDALEAQLESQGLLTDSVKGYIEQLYNVANLKVPPTQLDVDNAAALVKIQQLINALGSIPAAAKVGLNVTADGYLTYSDAVNEHNTPKHADGGTITGIGTGTSDSNLRRLSTGEEVIKASSAMQVRPLLKAINANPAAAVAAMSAASSSGSTDNRKTYNITGPDPVAIANEIDRRDGWKAA